MRKLKSAVRVRVYGFVEVLRLLWKEIKKIPNLIGVLRLFSYQVLSIGQCVIVRVYTLVRGLPAWISSTITTIQYKTIELIQLCQLIYTHVLNIPTELQNMFYTSYAVSTFFLKRDEWDKIHKKNLAAFPKLHKEELRGIFFNYWGYELWQIYKVCRRQIKEHFKLNELLLFLANDRNHTLWRNFWIRKLDLDRCIFRSIFVYLSVRFFFVIVYFYIQAIGALVIWTFGMWLIDWFPRFCYKYLTVVTVLSLHWAMLSSLIICAWLESDKWPDFDDDYLWENVYPVDKPKNPHKYDGKRKVFWRLVLFSFLCWVWVAWLCYRFNALVF